MRAAMWNPVVPTEAPKARSGGTFYQRSAANRRKQVPPLRLASLGFGRDDKGQKPVDNASRRSLIMGMGLVESGAIPQQTAGANAHNRSPGGRGAVCPDD